jgi:hypothetical protein
VRGSCGDGGCRCCEGGSAGASRRRCGRSLCVGVESEGEVGGGGLFGFGVVLGS